MHLSRHCNIFVSLKMLKLSYGHCLLICVVLLCTLSSSIDGTICNLRCASEEVVCINSLSANMDFNGYHDCRNKKFVCYKKCQKTSRVKKDTEVVRDQAVIFHHLKHLCANYCKNAYNRIEPVCAEKCSEKLFHGKISMRSLAS